MEIKRIDHISGQGSYIVQSRFGPSVFVTRFGPATLKECERFIERESIVAIEREETRRVHRLSRPGLI